MKNTLKLTLIAVALLLTVSLSAQIKEGKITAKQSMTSTDPTVASQLAMMGDLSITTYFTKDKSRTEQSGIMTGTSITIFDAKKKEGLMLMDNMMGKKYMKMNEETSKDEEKKMEVEKTSETETIAGYTCYKYIITIDGDSTNQVEMWVTKDLAYNGEGKWKGKIDGTPLRWQMTQVQMGASITVKYEVTEIKEMTVSDDKFDMTIPEGYTEMKKEEMMGFGG